MVKMSELFAKLAKIGGLKLSQALEMYLQNDFKQPLSQKSEHRLFLKKEVKKYLSRF
jgi:hypothetical protein